MNGKRNQRKKQIELARATGTIDKKLLSNIDNDFHNIADRKREKLVAYLERRTLEENRFILEFLAPQILISIEESDGTVDVRGMTEAEGVTIALNGGMIEILVGRLVEQ